MNKIKIVFMGTPLFAVPILKALIDNYNVVLVVSQPDKEKNRKGKLLNTATKEVALENKIEVFQPSKIREDYHKVLDCEPDIIITCAYGQFIPKDILNYPKYGCINVHGSLLPKLRGGAPIHHAIINGEAETGITIMKMNEKMDSGDIISQGRIEISKDDYLDIIYEKLSYLGRNLLIETLPSIIDGTANYIKQDESKVTFGLNITKEEEKIDFNNSLLKIFNQIRGLNSVPGAYCYYFDSRLKIYDVEMTDKESKGIVGEIVSIDKNSFNVNCTDYQLKVKSIKLEGKKKCNVADYFNGLQNKNDLIGKVLR